MDHIVNMIKNFFGNLPTFGPAIENVLKKLPVFGPIFRNLFNGFSGNRVAKVTFLWKLYHQLVGDYQTKLKVLHERHGPIVQVAPGEFSVSGKEGSLRFIGRLPASTQGLLNPPAIKVLQDACKMQNLFDRERVIDGRNQALQQHFVNAANDQRQIDLTKLFARYAYDLVITTTTGKPAGFLDINADPAKIDSAIKNWKFDAIIVGSYLRYNKYIKPKRENRLFSSVSEASTATTDEKLAATHDTDGISPLHEIKPSSLINASDHEAMTVLALAAADPAIILVTKALSYVYNNHDILHSLRAEFKASGISHVPTFKELILNKSRLPLLHAVLLECIRLHPIYISGLSYIAPDDGFRANGLEIPAGNLITPTCVVEHVNPEAFGNSGVWDPARWLNGATAELKRLLPAFNLDNGRGANPDTVAEFHSLIASKIIIQVVTNFDIAGDSLKTAKIAVADGAQNAASITEASNDRVGQTTPATLGAMDRLEQYLGADGVRLLLTRFNPDATGRGSWGREPLRVGPLGTRDDFYDLLRSVKSIYGGRLSLDQAPDKTVVIGTKAMIEYTKNKAKTTTTRPVSQPIKKQESVPAAGKRLVVGAWGEFAVKEHERQEGFKTKESWEAQKKQNEEAAQEAKASPPAQAPQFKATWKQTGIGANGKRKVVSTQTTLEPSASPAPVAAPRTLPPHLRKAAAGPAN
ncbi:uncharacterized protein MYCFIDRAFT_89926 [Pseudocercospora fijiensis CIRAD86]|uniref:Uncharacterized protein n=1 Tax=Pseudocercospora fijiensis (strain CIRAD86) TaxID=383855 RepID=N1QA20_PSEFD|nr:uncharacterized protein MYCFIDRAFT_89926 [Pseudocercospora fijiensis CIRAD86]EME89770.1 hypothetical protein MYCFIDRAFT_89926 [Pseudocercospora fijiensis CIRAD86]